VQVVPTCVCVHGRGKQGGRWVGEGKRRVRMRQEGIRGDGWARGLVVDYSGASLPVAVGDGGVHAFLQAQAVFVLGQRGVLVAVLAVVVVVDFRGRRGAPTPTAIGGDAYAVMSRVAKRCRRSVRGASYLFLLGVAVAAAVAAGSEGVCRAKR